MAAHISVPHMATHISVPQSAAHISVPHTATHISAPPSEFSDLHLVILLMFIFALLLAWHEQRSLRHRLDQREQVWRRAERQWQQHCQAQTQAQAQAQANAQARSERRERVWRQAERQWQQQCSELRQRCAYVEQLALMADAHVGAAARPSMLQQMLALKQEREGAAQPGGRVSESDEPQCAVQPNAACALMAADTEAASERVTAAAERPRARRRARGSRGGRRVRRGARRHELVCDESGVPQRGGDQFESALTSEPETSALRSPLDTSLR